MELHGQETEVALLGALRGHLSSGAFVDVGAERGGLAQALLSYGYGPAHLIEPAPANVAELRRAFTERSDVEILDVAAGASDGEATLYLATTPEGEPQPAFNAIDSPGDGDGLRWTADGAVALRSLESLLRERRIPGRVGLLKIDAEGTDIEVVRGMGGLECDALMIELWLDMPGAVGRCPWTLDDLVELLEPRGLRRLVFVHHQASGVRLVKGAAEPAEGDYGNVVFMTDRVYDDARTAIALVADQADRLSDALAEMEVKERNVTIFARAVEKQRVLIEEMEANRLRLESQLREQG
jgi:FkbM family methyltransferase